MNIDEIKLKSEEEIKEEISFMKNELSKLEHFQNKYEVDIKLLEKLLCVKSKLETFVFSKEYRNDSTKTDVSIFSNGNYILTHFTDKSSDEFSFKIQETFLESLLFAVNKILSEYEMPNFNLKV